MAHRSESVMLATLGGQPQVITFALDALLAQGENIVEVVILYLAPSDPRTRRALERLGQEFLNDFYGHARRAIRLRRVMLGNSLEPPVDIVDERAASALREQLREIVQAEKAQGRTLHLVLAGGRRLLALTLVPLAILYLDYSDRIWHLYTPREVQAKVRDGSRMHVGPETGVRLIQVHLPRWGVDFPALRWLASTRMAPAEDPDGLRRCDEVWAQLTEAQRQVLQGIAQGLTPTKVAERLGRSPKTVNSHLERIRELCRNAWEIPPDRPLSYHHLRDWFRSFPPAMAPEG